MAEDTLLIPKSVVIAIGDYLSKRPWSEVNQVMPVLQNLETLSSYLESTQGQSTTADATTA